MVIINGPDAISEKGGSAAKHANAARGVIDRTSLPQPDPANKKEIQGEKTVPDALRDDRTRVLMN